MAKEESRLEQQPSRDRRRAFRDAERHSRRVRLLRRCIVIGGLAAAALLALRLFFNPFGGGTVDFTTQSTSLNGSRIIMEKPRLSGYRADGRPYDLRAESGSQDIRTPNVVDLTDLHARIDTAETNDIELTAPNGTYDSAADTMVLHGDIRVIASGRFDIRLQEANLDFRAGTLVSDKPVSVISPTGELLANSLLISDNGRKISFNGGVETKFAPAGAATESGRNQ